MDQWMVLIAAFGDSKPPPDPDELRERMRRIGPRPFRVIAERCDMSTDVTTHSMAHSQRRRFGKLKALPGGLFAVGDAVASYNPVYGQGMTSAVLRLVPGSLLTRASQPRPGTCLRSRTSPFRT
ncbi:hypothetical protein [Streptomyces spectabilis]|uniref:hypothetical protein n=1 Tax=Streptomyces spectabilis TaxID=68270 RepID=UPI001CEF9156|nr:hypothetical protein [Streptomyces spectabilis]